MRPPTLALALTASCTAPAPIPVSASASASASVSAPVPIPASAPAPAPALPCSADTDCGYDPARARCVADPGANRQPPLRDQGIVCYCNDLACATLRVPPVPCESDASCAVRADPRPHPVAASAAHPHERGRPCRDFTIATTCERTNICTMTVLPCKKP